MENSVRRIFVEKKKGFNVEAQNLLNDLKESLNISNIQNVRIVNRYDIEGISEEEYKKSINTIFSDKTVDRIFEEEINICRNDKVFAVEYLPGQYDQRADSASQCVQILAEGEKSDILSSKLYILSGNISEEDFIKIKNYCINLVDSREASLTKPDSLKMSIEIPEKVQVLKDFIDMNDTELKDFMQKNGLAMSFEDLKFCQVYFSDTEKRNPTITEIKVIDTYWSDHCRHTTFMTELNNINIEDGKYNEPLKNAYGEYLDIRNNIYRDNDKKVCLMDIATIAAKELKKAHKLDDLDESEEINACSIVVDAEVNGKTEKWLVMFKNETHNHPTEIEPFGGAATCLGGAIRDPLSGRSYVYQAMRVTGCGDPRTPIEETLDGKLPQKKLTIDAAQGYSSYGNQIGLATGQVTEIYDPLYVAKRMEIGAVVGAAPYENVVRKEPEEGDIVILLGGRTGRDGCGGATGSSKKHTENSLLNCGAEVQKGNAPTERKIQRLFRNKDVTNMIKRCNDFGAGGVSVAIGELTDGLDINLDLVPKKYEGLDGTELAISESQERMAVVISKEDEKRFIEHAKKENLEAVKVARVTSNNRLRMFWNDNTIVDLNRNFLNTNGVTQKTDVLVEAPKEDKTYFDDSISVTDVKTKWLDTLRSLNVCSQKGLVERFDSTIGASTVIMPFGGKYQDTPQEGMAAKLPVLKGDTNTGTVMTYGFDPNISKWSPFYGALYAVVESAAKVAALGGDISKIRLTFQEYFERLGENPKRWGKPFSALLGALYAQRRLEIAAIGGKDSMSGSFKDMDVPPTLVSFALNVTNVESVVSAEFKKPGSRVILVPLVKDEYYLPDFEKFKQNMTSVKNMASDKVVLASSTIKSGSICEALSKMSFGNRVGLKISDNIGIDELFANKFGSLIMEISGDIDVGKYLSQDRYTIIGETSSDNNISIRGTKLNIEELYRAWEAPLEDIFPSKTELVRDKVENIEYNIKKFKLSSVKSAKPTVFIPVFPGTNCEYDSARAFENAGAIVNTMVFKNLSIHDIEKSVDLMADCISNSQIVMLPGGFSAGDEPDGSGKFIATVFRNPKIKDAVMELLNNRDGLMLGICNGFQALIKLGLVPFGEIRDIDENCPTLTYNKIGRHVSHVVNTRITSNLSPWFSNVNVGDIHAIAVSHGEGRFVANDETLNKLIKNGQIATQYVDFNGNASYDIKFNPNGSIYAVEGITSPDGRILGKMGHSERKGTNVLKNIPGNKDQKLFEAGVNYFK
ncbi:phosphoribosylformylglycinamidine synthase [Clostridium fermenticellae]|uniref:Phosphoribosylformylglycinamidine synthase n=1 Tax=Clostridium fermenticellae TaxID=2068654 RepID=A0A386H4A7_9CLOT|nr:phosphoribosylformylglycinamidine synthase [Clostridium fermenticellae]AYD40559.1 phosphoribosylformylglycinamidine synthase [Clostridium fermenticellae]